MGLNDMECPVMPQLAEDYKKLMVDWMGRNLTPQFDIDICEVACRNKECIVDFRWRAEPTPPQEYTRYKALSPKDKSIWNDQNHDFFRKGKVAIYLDDREMITSLNKRNLAILMYWFKLEGISAESRLSVEKYINTFSGRM